MRNEQNFLYVTKYCSVTVLLFNYVINLDNDTYSTYNINELILIYIIDKIFENSFLRFRLALYF